MRKEGRRVKGPVAEGAAGGGGGSGTEDEVGWAPLFFDVMYVGWSCC